MVFFCESSSPEEEECLREEYCRQVSSACSDQLSLDCSPSLFRSSSSSSSLSSSSSSLTRSLPRAQTPSPAPSPSPSRFCEEEVKEQLKEVSETAIAVVTCLNGKKEEIECCPNPYIFGEEDECVVKCPQYFYGRVEESVIRIGTFVVICLTLFVYLTSLVPLFLMTDFRFLFFSSLSSSSFFFLLSFSSLFPLFFSKKMFFFLVIQTIPFFSFTQLISCLLSLFLQQFMLVKPFLFFLNGNEK